MPINEGQLWRNNKKGTTYLILKSGVSNATNKNDGERMVVYIRYYLEDERTETPDNTIWCREENEFLEKFTYLSDYYEITLGDK